jgi:Domain of unknown function (DUF1648)
MTRRSWNTLIVLMWAPLVAMAVRFRLVWDRLPVNVASHFDAAGRANGWMPREASLAFTLGFMAFMLSVFSIVLYVLHRQHEPSAMSWTLLAFFQVEIWTIFFMLNSTLNYNLGGTPISVVPLMVITPLGVLVLLAVAFGEKRGHPFPSGEVLAEEVQTGRAWGVVFLVPLLAAIWVLLAMRETNLRLGAALLGLVFIAVLGMAWDGFHYYFTRHGLEIRTLGFRLKSVPAGDIEQYTAEDWNPICGYGIRGVGNRKAYVWGGKGVRIRMRDGEIFLGHNDPARMIQDLDFMKQSQESAGAS